MSSRKPGRDSERIVALEVGLGALDRLLRSERETNDKQVERAVASVERQLASMSDSTDRLAERSQVEKAETRIRLVEEAIADIRSVMVPRNELSLRLEGVTARQQTMSDTLGVLNNVLTALRAEIAGQDAGEQAEVDRSVRTRTWVLTALGIVIATAAIIVSIYLNDHTKVQIVPSPTTTTVPSLSR